MASYTEVTINPKEIDTLEYHDTSSGKKYNVSQIIIDPDKSSYHKKFPFWDEEYMELEIQSNWEDIPKIGFQVYVNEHAPLSNKMVCRYMIDVPDKKKVFIYESSTLYLQSGKTVTGYSCSATASGGLKPGTVYKVRIKFINLEKPSITPVILGFGNFGAFRCVLRAIYRWPKNTIIKNPFLLCNQPEDVHLPKNLPNGCDSLLYTFYGYGGKWSENIKYWNISQIIDMRYTFYRIMDTTNTIKNTGIENWDVTNVLSLYKTFMYADFKLNLKNWRPRSAWDVRYCWYLGANSVQDCRNWCFNITDSRYYYRFNYGPRSWSNTYQPTKWKC